MTKKPYKFIKETLFFPEEKILVVGDLHLGYDLMLQESGVLIPEKQPKEVIKRLEKIFKIVESQNEKINKIIFLGDIKHYFTYEFKEKNDFREVMDFLRKKFKDENIILIKGNHDTVDYSENKIMKEYHIENNMVFLHGHESYPEVFDKKIKRVVSGHLHPSVILEEQPKREMYKCFLTGKSKGKEFIILPSFLGIAEGTPVNNYDEEYMESFFIIPKKDILTFNVHVVGKDKIYDFGKVKNF